MRTKHSRRPHTTMPTLRTDYPRRRRTPPSTHIADVWKYSGVSGIPVPTQTKPIPSVRKYSSTPTIPIPTQSHPIAGVWEYPAGHTILIPTQSHHIPSVRKYSNTPTILIPTQTEPRHKHIATRTYRKHKPYRPHETDTTLFIHNLKIQKMAEFQAFDPFDTL